MSNIEHRLMRALAEPRGPVDEKFVNSISSRVEQFEATRRFRLLVLTIAALCLLSTLSYGLYLSWNAVRVSSLLLLPTWPTTAFVFSLALVTVVSVVLRPRTSPVD